MVGGTRRVCFFGKDRQRAARVVSELSDVREITLVSVVRPVGAVPAVLDRFQGAESRTMQTEFLRSRRAAALGSVSQDVGQLATCLVLIVKP